MNSSVTHRPAIQDSAADPSSHTANRLDLWIFPTLGVLSLIASCIIYSLKKQEWADEVFTRFEVGDRSLPHLMHALTRLGGAGMPLFSLTAWPWARVFGLSDLSLRLYSCAGMCGAFLVLIATLRRLFTARAAFLGAALGMFACMTVIDQNAEARGYGLYLLLCALAVAQMLRVAGTSSPAARDLLLLALTQAGMVLGHVLALIFSGLLLLALVATDLSLGRIRWRVYLCFCCGWLAILPWIPAIRASMDIAKPYGWLTAPTPFGFLVGFSCWLFGGIYVPLDRYSTAIGVVGWAGGLFCVVALVVAAIRGFRNAAAPQKAALLTGLALLAAPVAFYAVSQLFTPVWVPRYMMPATLGVAILSAALASTFSSLSGNRGKVLGLCLLMLPILAAFEARPEYLDVARVDQVSAGRPLVCDWMRDFTVMLRYSSDPGSIEYPLDWPAALNGPKVSVGAYHLLQNYRRGGYMTANLYDVSDVLNQPSFLVLDSTETNWFQVRIAGNPRYDWKVIEQIDATRRVIEVRRRQ